MPGRAEVFAGVTILLGLHDAPAGLGGKVAAIAPFALATVHMEQNATEGDVEVVFEVDGGDDGLAKLSVTAPDGRTVIAFTGASAIGIRQFRLESPEPADPEVVKSAYPAGVYTFAGATSAGGRLQGKATLIHELPRTAKILRPGGDSEASPKGLEIAWTAGQGLAAHMVTVEQEESGESITAKLPGSAHGFVVPEGFLRPGTEYKLGLGTVARGGNASFVEANFTTAGGEE